MILKGKILLEGWTESLIGVGSREKWRKGFGKNECYRILHERGWPQATNYLSPKASSQVLQEDILPLAPTPTTLSARRASSMTVVCMVHFECFGSGNNVMDFHIYTSSHSVEL